MYTTLTNFSSKSSLTSILLDRSTDGGATCESVSSVISHVSAPPLMYPNTNFRDGIEDTFAVGPKRQANGQFPLYVSWEDYSTGFGNLILSASYDGGHTWSAPIQVTDNANPNIDALQPNLTAAADGTVIVAFYDRRLTCAAGGADAATAGLALDRQAPFGATNYCINASAQLYDAGLRPFGTTFASRCIRGTPS